MREIAVGADDLVGAAPRQAVQGRLQFALCALILVPVEPDRRLADALDDIVNRFSLLLPDRVAEEPPRRRISSRRGRSFGGDAVEMDWRTRDQASLSKCCTCE